MKKFFLVLACSICVISAANVYFSQVKGEMKQSLFNNLEALANNHENGQDGEKNDWKSKKEAVTMIERKTEMIDGKFQTVEREWKCCKSITEPDTACSGSLPDC